MEITALEKQKKGNRRNLEVDGEFYCGVDESLIVTLDLYTGKKLDQKTLKTIKEEDEYQKCLKKAFDILAIRLNSEKEISTKLNKKFSPDIVKRAINRLIELGYINDDLFIDSWVKSRERSRGTYLLKRELALKGLDKQTIAEYFEKRDNKENDFYNAKKLIERKKWANLTREEKSKKVGTLLARHGFDYETIKKVLIEE